MIREFEGGSWPLPGPHCGSEKGPPDAESVLSEALRIASLEWA